MTWNAFVFFFLIPALIILFALAILPINDWAIRRDDRRAAEAASRQTPADAPRQG